MRIGQLIKLKENGTYEIWAGGPGSGCSGDNCGRPAGSGGGKSEGGGKGQLKSPPKGMHDKYSNDVGTVFEHDQVTGTYRTKSGAEYSPEKMRRLVKEGAYSKHNE
jgi:hypothetical protein